MLLTDTAFSVYTVLRASMLDSRSVLGGRAPHATPLPQRPAPLCGSCTRHALPVDAGAAAMRCGMLEQVRGVGHGGVLVGPRRCAAWTVGPA